MVALLRSRTYHSACDKFDENQKYQFTRRELIAREKSTQFFFTFRTFAERSANNNVVGLIHKHHIVNAI